MPYQPIEPEPTENLNSILDEALSKDKDALIRKTLLANGCPEDKINDHLSSVTRQLELDYQSKSLKFKSFWEYLCDFEADCLIDTYVETEFS